MFIYILNLLNDNLRKNNICGLPAFEVINDTKYISNLAGIKRNFDFKNFSNKIIEVFKILGKYRMTLTDSIGILNKLILNDNNSWILESIQNEIYINSNYKLEFDLSFIINSILLKYKIGEEQKRVGLVAL